jgi:hypothetical protein
MSAPTEDKADTEKEMFCDGLQTAINRTPKSYTILVLGDANAKLRRKIYITKLVGSTLYTNYQIGMERCYSS